MSARIMVWRRGRRSAHRPASGVTKRKGKVAGGAKEPELGRRRLKRKHGRQGKGELGHLRAEKRDRLAGPQLEEIRMTPQTAGAPLHLPPRRISCLTILFHNDSYTVAQVAYPVNVLLLVSISSNFRSSPTSGSSPRRASSRARHHPPIAVEGETHSLARVAVGARSAFVGITVNDDKQRSNLSVVPLRHEGASHLHPSGEKELSGGGRAGRVGEAGVAPSDRARGRPIRWGEAAWGGAGGEGGALPCDEGYANYAGLTAGAADARCESESS